MPNLAVVSIDKTAGNATRIATALQNGGHTVTLFDSSEAVAETLATFDVIVTNRSSSVQAQSEVIKAAFDMGIPLLCNGGANTTVLSPATLCRLATSVELDPSSIGSNWALVPDYAFTGVSITPPASISLGTAQYYYYTPIGGEAGSAVRLAQRSSADARGAVLFAPKGGLDLDGNPFPANIAFCGLMYAGTFVMSPNAELIANNLVNKLLQTGKVYKGVVVDAADAPVSRTVRAYLRQTGKLVAETVSDPVTGAFSIPAISDHTHYVVCLDLEAGTQNAKIFDRVIAVDP